MKRICVLAGAAALALGGAALAQTTVVTTTAPQAAATTTTVTVTKVYVPQGTVNTLLPMPAPWAPAPIGSVIETTIGPMTVKSSSGYTVVYEVGGKLEPFYAMVLDATARGVKSGDTAGWSGKAEAERLWPLEAGKSVSYSVDTPRGTRHDTIKVLRTEMINVPAGTFFTYVIERTERAPLVTAENSSTMWYAPAVGAIVKYEDKIGTATREPHKPYEVTQIRMPQPIAGTTVITVQQ